MMFTELPNYHVASVHGTATQGTRCCVIATNAQPNVASIANYNDTTIRLQGYLADAVARKEQLRPLGGLWSLSDVAMTSGTAISTMFLDYLMRVRKGDMHQGANFPDGSLFLAQGGASIASLNIRLKSLKRSLPTTGASNGQTIAGAIATGVHGAALKNGSVQDYVRALHFITAHNETVWIEKSDQPVMSDAWITGRLGARINREPGVFEAALVNIGAFGFLMGAVIETEPIFYLRAHRFRMTAHSAFWDMAETATFDKITWPFATDRDPHHFQILFNPYDPQNPIMTMMWKYDKLPSGQTDTPIQETMRVGAAGIEFLSSAIKSIPILTPAVFSLLTSQLYPDYHHVWGSQGTIFGDSNLVGTLGSLAIAVPPGRIRETVDLVAVKARQRTAPVFIGLRYVAGTDATLGFTRYKPFTCVLEIDGPYIPAVKALYTELWPQLETALGGIPWHWGKLGFPSSASLNKAYPPVAIADWKSARNKVLPTQSSRDLFSSDYLKRAGLV